MNSRFTNMLTFFLGKHRCSICDEGLQTEIGVIFHGLVHSAQFMPPVAPEGNEYSRKCIVVKQLNMNRN